MAEASASRAALLALRRERGVIEEGHRFLDEKRVAFAHELLQRARDYAQRQQDFARLVDDARTALAGAVDRHGLEGLQVYPPVALTDSPVVHEQDLFLGLRLVARPRLTLEVNEAPLSAFRTREGEHCGAAFRALAGAAIEQAARVANLLRLAAEYRRTERRVRAIENIVLPEVKRDERRFEIALEELDQEEVMRSRRFAEVP